MSNKVFSIGVSLIINFILILLLQPTILGAILLGVLIGFCGSVLEVYLDYIDKGNK